MVPFQAIPPFEFFDRKDFFDKLRRRYSPPFFYRSTS